MRLTPAMIRRCAEFVEQYGLVDSKYMEGAPGGAKIAEFCEAVGIPYLTFQRWTKNDNFVNAIKKALVQFRRGAEDKVYNALLRKATGYTATESHSQYRAQTVREFDPKTGKKIKEYTTDKGVKVSEDRQEKSIPPDTGAAIFLLTNLNPERWKNRRDSKTDIDLDVSNEEPPVIVFKSPAKEAGNNEQE